MSNIETISPDNNFSETEKKGLNSLIGILLEENSNLSKEILKNTGLTMMAVASSKGDCDLLSWLVTNNYAGVNDLIYAEHFEVANKMGFNIISPKLTSAWSDP
jgi:hypothetical protein